MANKNNQQRGGGGQKDMQLTEKDCFCFLYTLHAASSEYAMRCERKE